MEQYYILLTQCPLFVHFTPEQIAQTLSGLKADTKTYKKGQLIFMAWEPATSVGIMLDGTAQVIKVDYDGNRNILTQLRPPDLFGEVFACLNMPTLPVSVEATTDCTVLFINFKNLLLSSWDPAMCSEAGSAVSLRQQMIGNMLTIIAAKNMLLNDKITIMSCRTTQEKLMTFLYAQATAHGSKAFTISMDRQALADYLCVERSAMSAELSQLQKQGKIKYHKNDFTSMLYLTKAKGKIRRF